MSKGRARSDRLRASKTGASKGLGNGFAGSASGPADSSLRRGWDGGGRRRCPYDMLRPSRSARANARGRAKRAALTIAVTKEPVHAKIQSGSHAQITAGRERAVGVGECAQRRGRGGHRVRIKRCARAKTCAHWCSRNTRSRTSISSRSPVVLNVLELRVAAAAAAAPSAAASISARRAAAAAVASAFRAAASDASAPNASSRSAALPPECMASNCAFWRAVVPRGYRSASWGGATRARARARTSFFVCSRVRKFALSESASFHAPSHSSRAE